MKKLMFIAAAALAGSLFADASITSANIVGYQKVNIPTGYFIFTPTFKTPGTAAEIDLKTIKPLLPSGSTVQKDATVSAYVLNNSGNYETVIYWYGSEQTWKREGKEIADGAVMLANGKGVAFCNEVKINDQGVEPKKGGTATAIDIQVSGEVDLVCQNVVPSGYMINGNSTPVAINLKDITPLLPSGSPVTKDATVSVYMLDNTGNYETVIYWYGSEQTWKREGKAITDEAGALAVGQGFGFCNEVKINDQGVEPKKGGTATWIYLQLPSPVSAN